MSARISDRLKYLLKLMPSKVKFKRTEVEKNGSDKLSGLWTAKLY